MKAALLLLVAAVIGLSAQNYRLSKRLTALENRPVTAETTAWYTPSTTETDYLDRKQSKSTEEVRRELDSLSNALSDKGITWHPGQ